MVRFVLRRSLFILLGILIPVGATAQETFIYQGSSGSQVWEDSLNWTGGTGSFSTWPGEAAEAGTLDSASLSATLSGALNLAINTPGIVLDKLSVGALGGNFTTTIDGAGTLSANRIQSTGLTGAQTHIAVDSHMPNGDLTIMSGSPVVRFTGNFINHLPTQGEYRTIFNQSDGTFFFTGQMLLSDDSNNSGHLRVINGGIGNYTITGNIHDGDAPGGRVTYARGQFTITQDQYYTGTTQLGDNEHDSQTDVYIYTNQPFGTGRLSITGWTATKSIRPGFGTGPKTLENEIHLGRDVEFAGAENFTLNGTIFQSSSRAFYNNIVPSRSLTINGHVYASSSMDEREWIFDGTGNTVVNSTISDSLGFPQNTGGTLRKRGSGRVTLTNPDAASYGGVTTVAGGTLQLGDGGVGVKLNGNTVTGSATLELNHTDTLDFDSPIAGSLTVVHIGSGTTILSNESTSSGPLNVAAGKVMVTGGWGSGAVTVANNAILGGDGSIGGNVSVNSGGTLAPGMSTGSLSVGNLVLNSGSTFSLEIGGTSAGQDYDQLLASGSARLGGNLMVGLTELFAPSPSDEFTIVSAANLSGNFQNIASGERIETLGGEGSFLLTTDTSNDLVLLSDFQSAVTLSADFNGDSYVDAVDLAAWEAAFGENASADADGDGLSDGHDFLEWQQQFTGGPPSAAQAVPEPSCWLISLLVLASLPMRRTFR